jgi:hypothetical protein
MNVCLTVKSAIELYLLPDFCHFDLQVSGIRDSIQPYDYLTSSAFSSNCLRLGRDCSYTEPPALIAEEYPATALLPASQQAFMAKHSPRDFTLYYCAPHHWDIPSAALSIVQQSQQISLQRPIPRSCMMTIVQHYLPACVIPENRTLSILLRCIRYNYLAAGYKCVQHAVVGFAAYNHYQVTRNEFAQSLCITHTTIALKKLQEEIDRFGPANVDAIITAPLFLAGTAQDWYIA